jgi:hypothetical protein
VGLTRLPDPPRLEVGEEVLRLDDLDLARVLLPRATRLLLLLGLHQLLEDHALKEIVDAHVQLHQGQHQLGEDLYRLLVQGLQIDGLTS